MLQAGGVANFDQAARSVIRDYLNGKIKYFTIPPVVNDDTNMDENDEVMDEEEEQEEGEEEEEDDDMENGN